MVLSLILTLTLTSECRVSGDAAIPICAWGTWPLEGPALDLMLTLPYSLISPPKCRNTARTLALTHFIKVSNPNLTLTLNS